MLRYLGHRILGKVIAFLIIVDPVSSLECYKFLALKVSGIDHEGDLHLSVRLLRLAPYSYFMAMFNQRIAGILDHESSLDHIPLGRIESLVLDYVSKSSLLARIDFLGLLVACQSSSDLRCLDRSLSYVILRLECSRLLRILRVRICHIDTLSGIPVTILVISLVLLVYPVGVMSILIQRIGILRLSCQVCLRFILYNSCVSDSIRVFLNSLRAKTSTLISSCVNLILGLNMMSPLVFPFLI